MTELPRSNAQKKRDRAATKQEKQKAKKAKNDKREDQWTAEIDRQNPLFERYYKVHLYHHFGSLLDTNESPKAQNLFEDEAEWNEFMLAMRTDLPTTFRVTGSKACVSSSCQI